MWVTYANERFARVGIDIDDPNVVDTVKHGFYTGAAAMLELMQRVGTDDISEDAGVEMLTRLQEELDTYAQGRR